jgi:hypothetical protein
MSKPINWSTLPDKDKVQLVIEHIMGWTCFQRWEDTADDERWRIVSKRMDTTNPVAFWIEESQQWSISYQDLTAKVFDPLLDMNDAWQVLKYTAFSSRSGKSNLALLVHEVFMTSTEEPHDIDPFFTLGIVNAWTPSFLCIASLRAVGLQVEGEARS